MTKIRAHGERPVGGSTGPALPSPVSKRARGDAGVSICLTCHGKVDWIDDKKRGTWVPMEHGTKVPHRCKS